MKMRPFGHLLALEVARRRALAAVRPLDDREDVPVTEAVGRVTARAYRAPRPVPAFARATWDGYAFQSSSTRSAREGAPARLRLIGEVFAERRFAGRVGPGEAVAIATGAPVPAGADTVIPFEQTRVVGKRLEVPRRVARGDRIASPGDDFPTGARLVAEGRPLAPATLGALAASGFASVSVYRRPVVAIIPNGNELLPPGHPPEPGRIYESNNAALAAVVAASGGVPRTFRPVADRARSIERVLRRALATSDLVLATGGSSVGEHDFLPAVFPRLGRLLFHGISVRPGKPTLAAAAPGKLLLGLPGHPTSCLSNAYWLLLPILRRLAHRPGPGWTDGIARLRTAVEVASPGLATIVPLRLEDGWAEPTFRDSSAITSLEGANAFAVLPPTSRGAPRGRRLLVHRLDPGVVPGGG